MDDMIEFTPELFRAFKKAYQKAVNEKQGKFIWEGHEFLVTYSKYLIEYLEPRFRT